MKPKKDPKCGVCATSPFERNNYYYGKQFTVRDLLQEQSYFNDKRYLINRMVLGWGVVCGLDVCWLEEERAFLVEKGMALDCCGREIIVCEPQSVVFEDYDEHCRRAHESPEGEGKFVLCLEYDECNAEPVELPPIGCNDPERTEFNRIHDGFKLKIKKWEQPRPQQPGDHVGCLNRFKHSIANTTEQSEAPKCQTETLHQHLCSEHMKRCRECDKCDCVVLGTIYVKAVKPPQGYQQQNQKVEVRIDICTDRRFVYSNSLLYDLIYCHHGDLPHIVDFNWRRPAGLEREMDWDTFVELVKNGLRVYFDQKMKASSLNPHTFFVSFFHEDPDSGNVFVKRFPASEIKYEPRDGCNTALWMPDPDWFQDELLGQKSQLRGGVDVEITLRGSRIWDDRGKGLDGAFLADKLPTGNGTQGTEFVDWFRVRPRDDKKKVKPYEM